MVRLATRPRIASGADICSVAMLLAVWAISAAPPMNAISAARVIVGLAARQRMALAISTIQAAWSSAWRSTRASALAMKPPRVPPSPGRHEEAETLRAGEELVLRIDGEKRAP